VLDKAREDPVLDPLAEEMADVFPSVRPLPVHKERLRKSLLATMQNRQTLRVATPAEHRRWAFIAGATVASLLSLLGIAIYLLYSEGRRSAAAARAEWVG
jgi:hypothetical protein